jgi:hypothetical protein
VEEGLCEKASLVAGFREQARAGPSSKVGGGQLLGIKPGSRLEVSTSRREP